MPFAKSAEDATDTVENEARTGETCSWIGTWECGDLHHELIDIMVGETFPTSPNCGSHRLDIPS
jgi:hypothetical protein